MGPASRALLNSVSPNNFENETNPFGTAQLIEIGMGQARAHRVSYVGELGWELYISSDQCGHIFETIFDAGSEHNLKLCGMHMMDSCRMKKLIDILGMILHVKTMYLKPVWVLQWILPNQIL